MKLGTRLNIAFDFNLPRIHWNEFDEGNVKVDHCEVLLDIAFGNGLTHVVTRSTREIGNTSSLLDLIFQSSNISECELSIRDGISDNKSVFLCFKTTKGHKKSNSPIDGPDFFKADNVTVLDCLELLFDQFSASDGARDLDYL